jgi:hypothetical protein
MRRAVRLAGLTIGVLAILLVTAEFAFRLTAGQRLLYSPHPTIEYLPKPDQSVVQRGVRFETNEWGMRSPAAAREKPNGAFRILILGDSVVFGHTNINHADLATTLLSGQELGDGRKIETLNVSAPSWGPGNLLAWIEANDFLGADAVAVVLSSHDLDDNRTFAPPDSRAYPQEQPLFVLGDWIVRQLNGTGDGKESADPRSAGEARQSLPVLFERMSRASSGACLVIHSTVDELFSLTPLAEVAELREMAVAAGLDVVHARDLIDSSDYVDDIHLSAEGQADLAKAIMACPALAGGPLRG